MVWQNCLVHRKLEHPQLNKQTNKKPVKLTCHHAVFFYKHVLIPDVAGQFQENPCRHRGSNNANWYMSIITLIPYIRIIFFFFKALSYP